MKWPIIRCLLLGIRGTVVATKGKWSKIYKTPLVAAAAANLPDGKVLLWSAFKPREFNSRKGFTHTGIFNPQNGITRHAIVRKTGHDMFCPGTAVLSDGRILITGGADSAHVTMYHPKTNQWTKEPPMAIPRGYHSMTPLSDGSVFTLGGSWSGGVGLKQGEIWDPHNRNWTIFPKITTDGLVTDDEMGLYRSDNHLWLFQSPDGRILQAGPSKRMHWIYPRRQEVKSIAKLRGSVDTMNGNAVVFDVGKILTLGGAANYDSGSGRRVTHVIDMTRKGMDPIIRRVGNLSRRRVFCSSVVLPSGEVVVFGGQTQVRLFSDTNAVQTSEIWNPKTEQWRTHARHKIPRTYHSIGLLLNDGRVLAAGGGLCGTNCTSNHPDAEIFTPPYLLHTNGSIVTQRPILDHVWPLSVVPGSVLNVRVRVPRQNHTFALVRLSAVTHNVNTDLRRIPLNVLSQRGEAQFRLRIPGNPAVVPPGNYFLFAMDRTGVPSVATTLNVRKIVPFRPIPNRVNPICSSLPLGSHYQIVSRLNRKRGLQVDKGTVTEFANVTLARRRPLPSMTWFLNSSNDGYYQIQARHSSKAMTVRGRDINDGSHVFQRFASGAINRHWCIVKVGKWYQLLSRHSRQLLQVVDRDTVQIGRSRTRRNDPRQLWDFVPLPPRKKNV